MQLRGDGEIWLGINELSSWTTVQFRGKTPRPDYIIPFYLRLHNVALTKEFVATEHFS